MSIYTLILLLALTATQALAQSNAISRIAGSEVLFANNFSQFVYEFNDKEDVVCSPFGSFLLLAHTLFGASGSTSVEVSKALALPNTLKPLDFKKLLSQLNSAKKVQVNVANRLIVPEGLQLKEWFINIAKNEFDTEIVPFSGSAVELADDVNSWVSSKTNHKINNLINAKDIDEQLTKLILLNAVYFNGGWLYPFNADLTVLETFTALNGLQYQVPTMKLYSTHLNHGRLNKFNAVFVELPYKNPDFKLVIVVHEKNKINAAEFNALGKELQKYNFKNLPKRKYSSGITLSLPKFKIESLINLQPVLEKMNVKEMFTDQADFGGMLQNSQDRLKVTKIIQKVFIDVNEVGSEAGAVSESESSSRMAPFKINVNVPFYFSIESTTYGVLFRGRVLLPNYA